MATFSSSTTPVLLRVVGGWLGQWVATRHGWEEEEEEEEEKDVRFDEEGGLVGDGLAGDSAQKLAPAVVVVL